MKMMLFAAIVTIGYLAGLTALAGGPEIEFDRAHVDNVAFDYRGAVLTVSGTAKLFVPKVPEDPKEGGNAKWVTLPAAQAEIRYLGGELYAVSLSGRQHYEERILALKGTVQHLQMWGTTAVVEGGHLSKVTARVVFPLIPLEGERRFAIDRLEELTETNRAANKASEDIDAGAPNPQR
jgi:hypothetical protein